MPENKAVTAYIGLGSNLGDSKTLLQQAWQTLGEVEGIELDGLSSPYMTAPVDMTSQHWFTNAAGRLRVSLAPGQLLRELLKVEATYGRTRSDKKFGYQDRSLDLDLLYYGDLVMDSPELTLPHPRIGDRLFVLVPLLELEPGLHDIASNEPIGEILARLQQKLEATPGKKQEIIHGSWNE